MLFVYTYFYLSSLFVVVFPLEWKSYLTQKKKNPTYNRRKKTLLLLLWHTLQMLSLSRFCVLMYVVLNIALLSLWLYCNGISGGVGFVHNISSYGINECYLWRLETRAREFVVYGYCRRKFPFSTQYIDEWEEGVVIICVCVCVWDLTVR